MLLRFSTIISYLLHPLFMPFYAMLLVLNLNTYISFSVSPHVQQVLVTIVFITTALLPIATTVFMYQRGMFSTLEMENAAERNWPFVATAVYYFMGYWLISQLPIPVVLSDMVLGAAVSILLAWAINHRWKISIHMVGIGGFAGILIGLSTKLDAGLVGPVLLVLFLAGCLGLARLILGSHSHAQVYAGFLMGMICEWWFVGSG